MKDFLFAVVLSFALMVSVAAIAVLVPGAKYVFAFCGLCAVAFVALAYYERRKYERDGSNLQARGEALTRLARLYGCERRWFESDKRLRSRCEEAIRLVRVRAGQRWEPVLDARVRSGHGRDTVRE